MKTNKKKHLLKFTNILKFSLLLFVILSRQPLKSQDFAWAKNFGGDGVEKVNSITTDKSGNVYTLGTFSKTADFDPSASMFNLTALGNYDIFISKLDSKGDFVWAKQISGTEFEIGGSIATDPFGNVFITGSFQGTVDFDPGATTFNLTSKGNYDGFVCKLDEAGKFKWVRQIGSTETCTSNGMIIDVLGNPYITGQFTANTDFDMGQGTSLLTSFGQVDAFICKFDGDGSFNWVKQIGGAGNDRSNAMVFDKKENIYLTGRFDKKADFDPGANTFELTPNGSSNDDVFICKFDHLGNFIWAKQIGSSSSENSNSIAIDTNCNVYTTGFFNFTVDFDPGKDSFYLTSNGKTDIFLSKLDSNGNFMWAKSFGGPELDEGNSVVSDGAGNVFATGYFNRTVDFDPSSGVFYLNTTQYPDAFIIKLNASGDFIWAGQMGGKNTDEGIALTSDFFGNIITTGQFSDTADFDPRASSNNLISAGSLDVFVQKMNASAAQSIPIIKSNIRFYPNPNQGIITIDFGQTYSSIYTKVLNIQGRVLKERKYLNTEKINLNFDGPKGFYIVELRYDDKYSVLKTVKN